MEVYLVPVGNMRYELYCEVADDHAGEASAAPHHGVLRQLVRRFREMIAAAERERHHAPRGRAADGATPAGRRAWARRVRYRMLRWVAEAIAEQRLLWHLRRQHHVTFVYPTDLDEAPALTIIREALQRDANRHRFWLVVNATGLLLSAVLTPIPGPNVLFAYFAFRVVGHYLSRRGARHGLGGVTWHGQASVALAELHQALGLAPAERRERVQSVAARLKLQYLAAFVERTAVRSV